MIDPSPPAELIAGHTAPQWQQIPQSGPDEIGSTGHDAIGL